MPQELTLPPSISRHVAGREMTRDAVGRSAAGVYRFTNRADSLFLKVQPWGGELSAEHRNLLWLQGRLPVPRVMEWCEQGGLQYLLLSGIPGAMACDGEYLSHSEKCISLLAEGLQTLWSVNVNDCPLDNRLDRKLQAAAENVRLGLVDVDDWNEDTPRRFSSPRALLDHLTAHRPQEDLAFTHGDYCLPNIFGDGERLTGLIDWGRAGVADRWQDIALGVRSLDYNGCTGLSSLLYGQLGIAPDPEKLDYYILLDELF